MNPSLKTTHVIPRHMPPVRASIATMLVCRYCMSAIGAYTTPMDRARIEALHTCPEKLCLGKPAVSVPYN